VDTKQYTLSSYGALELGNKGSIEAVLGVAKATHKVGKSNTLSADQGSNQCDLACLSQGQSR
jgi:hypothetical protein